MRRLTGPDVHVRLLHLQTAACGRPSPGTVAAVADHLRLEAEEGGYVAEDAVAPRLDAVRAGAGALLGHDAGAVLFTTGATDALSHLLHRWPLPEVGEVGVTPGEWGPNLDRFSERGLRPRELDVDDHGVLDLEALARTLRERPPTLVHLVRLASHRALIQPVAEAALLCREAGVPLWVDEAQSFAHLATTTGADAGYAPARKWLAGPRGVGVLAVGAAWREGFDGIDEEEASVASRVGAAHALTELDPGYADRLAAVGATLRAVLTDVDGWELADPPGATGALVGLRPTVGQDVQAEERRLHRDHRILTSACLSWRAPGDMTGPLLRLAGTALAPDDIERLTGALRNGKHPGG